jgi:thymidylate synthase
MKQYHDHLKAILERGSYKEPAREGMPGTTSLFGYQNRYNLQDGFPILTTKKINFKNIVVELLWFLRGDTNIKYLIDNGCNIWNEDAYNYYIKEFGEGEGATREYWRQQNIEPPKPLTFEDFIRIIKEQPEKIPSYSFNQYTLGDCGHQYGKVWRNWVGTTTEYSMRDRGDEFRHTDQLVKVISNIKSKPYDRRKVITAVDPNHDKDLALYWCHCLFQFNCRRLTELERALLARNKGIERSTIIDRDEANIPKYYLDCQMYQRSADMFLGVPYNISSYALLTHIIAKICNMIPGDFVHSFGDAHIYDNHREQVTEILSRDPSKYPLPKLKMMVNTKYQMSYELGEIDFDKFIKSFEPSDFTLEGYESYPAIKAELSTGLKK